MLVLHAPKHACNPDGMPTAGELNMTVEEWQGIFLPQEMLPDWSGMGPSSCNYYNYSLDSLREIREQGGANVAMLQVCHNLL